MTVLAMCAFGEQSGGFLVTVWSSNITFVVYWSTRVMLKSLFWVATSFICLWLFSWKPTNTMYFRALEGVQLVFQPWTLWLPGVHLITGLSGSVHSGINLDGDIEGMHWLTGISLLWSHLVQYEVMPRCVLVFVLLFRLLLLQLILHSSSACWSALPSLWD